MMLLSLIFLIFSVLFIKKGKISIILLPIISFIFLFLYVIYIIADYFTGKGIDESFIYHLKYGIEGAGIKSDLFIIILGSILFILSIIISIFIYKFIKNKSINKNGIINIISIIFLFCSFLFHPFFKNILDLYGYNLIHLKETNSDNINNGFLEETFFDLYKIPKFSENNLDKKNIIFIYLESYENLYLDNNLFPGLYNNLRKLRDKSIYFNNINQVFGTTRTIASMVGSQCGIPLIISGGGSNSMYGIDSFLPKAYCIGDFLKNAGYNLNYMGGADIKFAGKGNYYYTHGFSNIEGKTELINKNPNKKINDWGLYDDDFFDLAYEKYEILSKREEKFGLFLVNLDTHGPKGFLSSSCNEYIYTKRSKNSILNSYYCVDKLVTNFINKVKNNKNFKDTIFVIASDHYAYNHNNSIDIIKTKGEEERKMLFFIIDDVYTRKVINKKGNTLDIGPTVLYKMGFDVNNLGLGVNLFYNELTLEEKGNFDFKKLRNEYESFWEYPSLIKKGIKINTIKKSINIDSKNIDIPCLIKLDNNLNIQKILWKDLDNPSSLIENIENNNKSIYIDYCKKLNYGNNGFCIRYNKNNGNHIIKKLNNNDIIEINTIKILLN